MSPKIWSPDPVAHKLAQQFTGRVGPRVETARDYLDRVDIGRQTVDLR